MLGLISIVSRSDPLDQQAAAEGIDLIESIIIPRNNVNTATYMERFPLSQGKIPAIEGPNIKITETVAIATVNSLLAVSASIPNLVFSSTSANSTTNPSS